MKENSNKSQKNYQSTFKNCFGLFKKKPKLNGGKKKWKKKTADGNGIKRKNKKRDNNIF